MNFSRSSRARVAAAQNRFPEAIALLQQSLAKEETTEALIYLGRIYALTGEREKALAKLKRVEELDGPKKEPDKYVSPAQLAILYDALGMRDRAFENLERAFAEQDVTLPWIYVETEYDTMRDDPRFQDLLRRLNLAQ